MYLLCALTLGYHLFIFLGSYCLIHPVTGYRVQKFRDMILMCSDDTGVVTLHMGPSWDSLVISLNVACIVLKDIPVKNWIYGHLLFIGSWFPQLVVSCLPICDGNVCSPSMPCPDHSWSWGEKEAGDKGHSTKIHIVWF